MRTLLIAAVLSVAVHAPASAAEHTPTTLSAELSAAECYLAASEGDPCDIHKSRMKIDVIVCLVSQFPLLKALKTAKSVLRAIFSGKGLLAGFGAFFCAGLWNTYWDWRMCIATAGQSLREASIALMEEIVAELEDMVEEAAS